MQIAIVGAGRIGSTFAYHLARSGHAVTVMARGARLEQLQRDNAIVPASGDPAPVRVSATLDTKVSWDLVLVTVLASQVNDILPTLQASAAKKVIFLFNTVESLSPLRDTVGASRFASGFPMMTASLVDGKLRYSVTGPGMVTTVSDADCAKTFVSAGMPSVVYPDMESYLRSHAAFVIPMMAMACQVHSRHGNGISWAEAQNYARALAEAFRAVRAMGNTLTPTFVAAMSYMPTLMLTPIFWSMSRAAPIRELGAFGPGEVRSLIDAMSKAVPGQTTALQAIRP